MNETEMGMEVADIARRVYAWQETQELTTARMIREFRGIGSERTYRDLRAGNTDRYDVEQQLENYRGVWAEIESREKQNADEEIYDDLSAVSRIRMAALNAMRTSGINRVVMAFGSSGIGKTFAKKWLIRKYGSRIIDIEASVVWGDSPNELLGDLLLRAGAAGLPPTMSQRMERATAYLRSSRRMIAVDEAQHMGPRCLGTIKTLVNRTPGEWLLLSQNTLRRRLDMDAYQEARQLSENRLMEIIQLMLSADDVERYLRHLFPSADRAQVATGAEIMRAAADGNGNMSFVRDASETARNMLAPGEELMAHIISEAVKSETSKRRAGGK